MGADPVTLDVTAWVRIGEVETQYRRVGSGPPVLLLVVPTGEPTAALTARWRFLLPLDASTDIATADAAAAGRTFAGWLEDFLEGLGIFGLHVVVPPLLAADVTALRKADPERVARVVTVPDTGADWATIGASLAAGDSGAAAAS